MSSISRFLLSFLIGASLIIFLSACGGSFDEPEESVKPAEKPAYCHPQPFNGPQPKECYPS